MVRCVIICLLFCSPCAAGPVRLLEDAPATLKRPDGTIMGTGMLRPGNELIVTNGPHDGLLDVSCGPWTATVRIEQTDWKPDPPRPSPVELVQPKPTALQFPIKSIKPAPREETLGLEQAEALKYHEYQNDNRSCWACASAMVVNVSKKIAPVWLTKKEIRELADNSVQWYQSPGGVVEVGGKKVFLKAIRFWQHPDQYHKRVRDILASGGAVVVGQKLWSDKDVPTHVVALVKATFVDGKMVKAWALDSAFGTQHWNAYQEIELLPDSQAVIYTIGVEARFVR